jgi:hypothetical protein
LAGAVPRLPTVRCSPAWRSVVYPHLDAMHFIATFDPHLDAASAVIAGFVPVTGDPDAPGFPDVVSTPVVTAVVVTRVIAAVAAMAFVVTAVAAMAVIVAWVVAGVAVATCEMNTDVGIVERIGQQYTGDQATHCGRYFTRSGRTAMGCGGEGCEGGEGY